MKASFFSLVAAAALFATTAASVTPVDHACDLRRLSPRTRYEQAQRARERHQANELARWKAQHRHNHGPARSYGHH